MAKPLALLSLSVLLLAGCAGGRADEPPGEAAGSASPRTYKTVVGQSTAQAYTDTLHLLAWPASTTEAPKDAAPLRIPIEPFATQAASGYFNDGWDYTWAEGTTGLAGNLTVWVEVVGSVTNAAHPLNGGCFWSFSLVIGSYETGDFHGLPCVPEAGTVAPGIRQLVVPFDLSGIAVPAGTPVHWEMHVQDLSRAPGAEVNVLTASTQYDSTLTIAGLQLPLDPSLLLQTTA